MPACPVYEVKPRESLAPRGQVFNVRALLEGRLAMTPGLAAEIYDCMACRGCESVCPAGVPVGSIMEEARDLITTSKTESVFLRWAKRFLLSGVVAHPNRISILMGLFRLADRLGLRRFFSMFSFKIKQRSSMLPSIPKPKKLLPRYAPIGQSRKRVALFSGCIAPYLFSETNEATARVLQRNGYEVIVPEKQVCCGALHLHNGLAGKARELARANIDAFKDVETIVVNAAGCGAALSEYGELLDREHLSHEFASRVVDISALLVRDGFETPAEQPSLPNIRVAYDAPCHLFHAQNVKTEPRELLERIPGVELIDFPDPERCCGSAGIYNVTHFDLSMEVLESKMKDIVPTQADVIVTGNPGCHMQLSHGARKSGLNAEVVHPVVLLDRAYRGDRG